MSVKASQPPNGELPKLGAEGGVRPDVYDAVTKHPALTRDLALGLLAAHFPAARGDARAGSRRSTADPPDSRVRRSSIRGSSTCGGTGRRCFWGQGWRSHERATRLGLRTSRLPGSCPMQPAAEES